MRKFRTDFPIEEATNKIDYSSKILLIGSCFSQNISDKMHFYKFDVLSNPFGMLYNPYSILEAFRMVYGDRKISKEDLVFHEGLWHSFMHHSSVSSPSKDELLAQIETINRKSLAFIKKIDYLFITFGTSWVYQLKKNRQIVANCHKVPEREFKRFRLSTCDIRDEFTGLIQRMHKLNPQLNVVFTISPVRHLKDGAIGNQISKSILNVAVHEMVEQLDRVSYFPSYELMMDDLRDYRFYMPDMVHISDMAIDYIFDRFTDVYLDKITQMKMNEVAKIKKSVEHRPFDPRGIAYKEFVNETLKKINRLAEQFPGQDWQQEREVLDKTR